MAPIGMGDVVILSNRQRGIVVDLNGNDPLRPVVRLFQSGIRGSQFCPELDLAKRSDIGIASVVPTARRGRVSTARNALTKAT